MMGAPDVFKDTLGDFPDEPTNDDRALAAKALVRAGLAVVILQPLTKKPACTLPAALAKRADLEAQKAAVAAENPNADKVRHDCGRAHVITDVKDLAKARVKELLANGANLAVQVGVGATRVMVVDIDTREQATAFRASWERETGQTLESPMTVTSPGQISTTVDGEEVWVHKDGGHYWLTIPDDVEIPPEVDKIVGEGGWTIYIRDAYALVPPSVRPEGYYRLTGSVLEAPRWVLDRVKAKAVSIKERRARAAERALTGPGDIDDWAADTSWSKLLTQAGWTDAQEWDSCGCPTWTRPGSPAHSKSATAHEAGCPRYDTSLGWGPLHIWSDAVEINGQKTVTKLTFLAWSKYGGDVSAAMKAVGVRPKFDTPELTVLDPFDSLPTTRPSQVTTALVPVPNVQAPATPSSPSAMAEAFSDPKAHEEEDVADAEEVTTDPPSSWSPVSLDAILDGTQERRKADLFPRSDLRSDGTPQCLLYRGLVHSFHGESESGKSLILIHEAVRLMNSGEDVLWVTFDSDPEEDVGRALRMGARKDAIRKHLHYLKPDEPPTTNPAAYRALFYTENGEHRSYALAVIDGVTDAVMLFSGGTKGDPNEVYTQFSRIFPRRLASLTGACVVVVDHVSKSTEDRGRFAIGAQAKMSQLTGAAYVVEPDQTAPTMGGIGYVVLRVAKDRPGDVRRASGERRGKDRTQEAARIKVDDTGSRTVVTVEPPNTDPFAPGTSDGVDIPVEIMVAISQVLEGAPGGMTGNEVEGSVRGNAKRKRSALKLLADRGFTRIEERGSAKVHTLVRPFTPEGLELTPAKEIEAAGRRMIEMGIDPSVTGGSEVTGE